MTNAAFICPNSELAAELIGLLNRVPSLALPVVLREYPPPEQLLRTMRLREIDVLFLSVEELAPAEALAAAIDRDLPGTPVITLGTHGDPSLLSRLMHLGVREHLLFPFQGVALAEALDTARRRFRPRPEPAPQGGDLYTFFPARAGVGATTLAAGASAALAAEMGVRTLLVDCDLGAGCLRFLLKLGQSASVVDALAHAESLDAALLAQMTGRWHTLDVLHAGRLDPLPLIEPDAVPGLLFVARQQFPVICADLPSSLDPLAIAFLRQSQGIFLVTTPEVISLHMAKVRVQQLADLGLKDRASLIVNRVVRNKAIPSGIEDAVGLPVAHTVANDYLGVQSFILDGSPSVLKGDLRRHLRDLAQMMAPGRSVAPAPPKRKFLEFFHVPNLQDSGVARRD